MKVRLLHNIQLSEIQKWPGDVVVMVSPRSWHRRPSILCPSTTTISDEHFQLEIVRNCQKFALKWEEEEDIEI